MVQYSSPCYYTQTELVSIHENYALSCENLSKIHKRTILYKISEPFLEESSSIPTKCTSNNFLISVKIKFH